MWEFNQSTNHSDVPIGLTITSIEPFHCTGDGCCSIICFITHIYLFFWTPDVAKEVNLYPTLSSSRWRGPCSTFTFLRRRDSMNMSDQTQDTNLVGPPQARLQYRSAPSDRHYVHTHAGIGTTPSAWYLFGLFVLCFVFMWLLQTHSDHLVPGFLHLSSWFFVALLLNKLWLP